MLPTKRAWTASARDGLHLRNCGAGADWEAVFLCRDVFLRLLGTKGAVELLTGEVARELLEEQLPQLAATTASSTLVETQIHLMTKVPPSTRLLSPKKPSASALRLRRPRPSSLSHI